MIAPLVASTEASSASVVIPLLLYVAGGLVAFVGGFSIAVGLYRILRGPRELAPPTCRRCGHVVGSGSDPAPVRCTECSADLRGPDRVVRSRAPRARVAIALAGATTVAFGGVAATGYLAIGLDVVKAVRDVGEDARRAQGSAAPLATPQPDHAFRPSLWLAPALPPAALVAMAQADLHAIDSRTAAFLAMDGLPSPDRDRRLRARVAIDLLVSAIERGEPMPEVAMPIERLSAAVAGSARVGLSDAIAATLAEAVSLGVADPRRVAAAARSLFSAGGSPRVSLPTDALPGALVCATVTRPDHVVHGWCQIDEILIDGEPAAIVASDGRADRALAGICAPAAPGVHEVVVRWRSGVAIPDPEDRWSFPVPRGTDASARSLGTVVGEARRELHVAARPLALRPETNADEEPLRAGFGRIRLSILGGGTGAGGRTAALMGVSGRSTLAWDGTFEVEIGGAWMPFTTIDPSYGAFPIVSALLPIPADALGEELRIRYVPRTTQTYGNRAAIACDEPPPQGRALEDGALTKVWSRETVYTLRRLRGRGSFGGNDDAGEVIGD